jgi:hypothetical protein
MPGYRDRQHGEERARRERDPFLGGLLENISFEVVIHLLYMTHTRE